MVKSRYIGDGHPTFNRNPYNGYINPYYWVDDHPLLYGNNGSLDPGTHEFLYDFRLFLGSPTLAASRDIAVADALRGHRRRRRTKPQVTRCLSVVGGTNCHFEI